MKSDNIYSIAIEFDSRSCLVSYYDTFTKEPQVMDFSGGYGNKRLPLVIQYDLERDCFYYENQVDSHHPNSVIIDNLFSYLIIDRPIRLRQKVYTPSSLFVAFINHIIEKLRAVNPRSSVASVALAMDDSYVEPIKDLLKEDVDRINSKEVLFVNKTTALLHRLNDMNCLDQGRFYIFDYGIDYLTICEIMVEQSVISICNKEIDKGIAFRGIYAKIFETLLNSYNNNLHKNKNSVYEIDMIHQISEHYLNTIIKGLSSNKWVPIYFNFSLPAFKYVFDYDQLNGYITEMKNKLYLYIKSLETKGLSKLVIIGKGFLVNEMNMLVRNAYENTVNLDESDFTKGAVLYSLKSHKLANHYTIQRKSIISNHYGLMLEGDSFIPLVKKGWVYNTPSIEYEFIVDFEDDKDCTIDIYMEDDKQYSSVEKVTIEKKQVIDNKQRISLSITINEDKRIKTTVKYLSL